MTNLKSTRPLLIQVFRLLIISSRLTTVIFFNTEDAKLAKQKIKTWCKKTRRSEVVKKGTDSDKAKLAPPGKLNSPHGQKRTFSVPNRRGPNKVAKRGSKKGSNVDSSLEL